MTTTDEKEQRRAIRELEAGPFLTLASRLPHGGSLQARKLSTGAVQFYWRYSQDGKTPREPIGAFDAKAPPKSLKPTAAGGYTIAAALRRCDELGQLQQARATTGGIREVKHEERRAFEVKKAVERDLEQRTLGRLVGVYVAHLKAAERRSWYDAENLLTRHIEEAFPKVWNTPAAEVTSDDIVNVQRRLIDAGKGRTSNKLRSFVRAAFQCALDVRSDATLPAAFTGFKVQHNPAAEIKRARKFERADKRALSTEDLRAYWRVVKHAPGVKGSTLSLHLLTGGQRIEQLLRLRWADVTEDAFTIFDGKGRRDQPRAHTVPLVKAAAAILKRMPRKGEFVFSTADDGNTAINSTTASGWAQNLVGTAIEDFQLKRVRSGTETLLAAGGFSREIRGQLQSHGLSGIQDRHYDAHSYLSEKRQALEYVYAQLNSRRISKVIQISSARKRA